MKIFYVPAKYEEEIKGWCFDKFGIWRHHKWSYNYGSGWVRFYFWKESDIILFDLTWGDKVIEPPSYSNWY